MQDLAQAWAQTQRVLIQYGDISRRGGGPFFNAQNPRKLDHALKVGPDVIVTANPGCLLQLKSGLAERASHVAVKHLAEVLDAATAP